MNLGIVNLSNGDAYIFVTAKTESEIYVVLTIWYLMPNRSSSDRLCCGLEDRSSYGRDVFRFKRATQQLESDTFDDTESE